MGLLLAAEVGLNNLSLLTLSVAFHTMAKASTPAFVLLFSTIFGLERPNWKLAMSVVLVIGGIMVIQGQTEIGIVVAFISGFSKLSDPIRELITYYRDAAQPAVKHQMIADWM